MLVGGTLGQNNWTRFPEGGIANGTTHYVVGLTRLTCAKHGPQSVFVGLGGHISAEPIVFLSFSLIFVFEGLIWAYAGVSEL